METKEDQCSCNRRFGRACGGGRQGREGNGGARLDQLGPKAARVLQAGDLHGDGGHAGPPAVQAGLGGAEHGHGIDARVLPEAPVLQCQGRGDDAGQGVGWSSRCTPSVRPRRARPGSRMRRDGRGRWASAWGIAGGHPRRVARSGRRREPRAETSFFRSLRAWVAKRTKAGVKEATRHRPHMPQADLDSHVRAHGRQDRMQCSLT